MAQPLKSCPHCLSSNIIKKNFYYIKTLKSYKRRYLCKNCRKTFSSQTLTKTWYHKKPHLNSQLLKLLLEGSTQRAASRILKCSRSTVENKFKWLICHAEFDLNQYSPKAIYIDEMETIEHTKLKPLTLPLCVTDQYQILSLSLGSIPAKGKLQKISEVKYGPRANQRKDALIELFEELKVKLKTNPEKIVTDAYPMYPELVKKYFPKSKHEVHISRELKEKKRERLFELKQKKVFDPMFAINQRCAKLRSDIRRLTRRSWCTTKKVENLYYHLKMYQAYNNQNLELKK